MAKISRSEAEGHARRAGFVGEQIDIICAIAEAESGLNTHAVNTAGNTPPSRDRGILQINDHWHSEVSDACAFDPACAFGAGYRISAAGTNFRPWTVYTTGAYRQFLKGTGGGPRPGGVEAARQVMVPGYTWFSGWGEGRPGGRYHQGEDLGANRGAPIYAPEAGVIIDPANERGSNPLGGHITYLRGDSGLWWYFAHFDRPSHQPIGKRVTRGTQIATVGTSGDAMGTPPHLHYQVGPSGVWGDPRIVLANYDGTGGGGDGDDTDPACITVYSGKSYTGKSATICGDENYVAVGALFGPSSGPQHIESIRANGAKLTLFRDVNFAGPFYQTQGEDIPDTAARIHWAATDPGKRISSIKFGLKIRADAKPGVLWGPANDRFDKISSGVHKILQEVPGFHGIALAIDQAEQFPGIISYGHWPGDIWRGVARTTIENTRAAVIRLSMISLGMLILAGLMWNLVREPVMAAADVAL